MREPASDVYRLGLMMRQIMHHVPPRQDPGPPDLLEALTVMEVCEAQIIMVLTSKPFLNTTVKGVL
jgi:hypothetical protein